MEEIQEAGRLEKVIQTLDHLLWEAVARKCGEAYSVSFQKTGNSARVVYRTREDLRERLNEIKEEVDFLISQRLPIRKIQTDRWIREMEKLSSRPEYFQFFLELYKEGKVFTYEKSWELVKIGEEICCPCNGQHLHNTSELKNSSFSIFMPKKVGKNTYEFRFSVTII